MYIRDCVWCLLSLALCAYKVAPRFVHPFPQSFFFIYVIFSFSITYPNSNIHLIYNTRNWHVCLFLLEPAKCSCLITLAYFSTKSRDDTQWGLNSLIMRHDPSGDGWSYFSTDSCLLYFYATLSTHIVSTLLSIYTKITSCFPLFPLISICPVRVKVTKPSSFIMNP